jgi:hypothetical protein
MGSFEGSGMESPLGGRHRRDIGGQTIMHRVFLNACAEIAHKVLLVNVLL